jgi:AcrR family transcriptional regulator
MARPTKPLINRAAAVRAALQIIDDEGLEAFSLPRLAGQLGVSAPSLYHHFRGKSDILMEVARHIAGIAVEVPETPAGPGWMDFFVLLASNFRKSVLGHRNAARLLLHYRPRELIVSGFEDAARFLRESRVPTHLHVQILDGIEMFALGTVLTESFGQPNMRPNGFGDVDAHRRPALAAALASCSMDATERFESEVRDFLRGVVMRNEDWTLTHTTGHAV